jgi:sulfur-oxidizing protein SoxY
MKRRTFIAASGAMLAGTALPATAQSPTPSRFQPPQDVTPIISKLTHGATAERAGVEIELPQIAENGNSVPMRIRVKSPMTPEDHVTAIYLISERNPRPLMATFHLGPQSGKAEISTRVRLAGTQQVTVLAELSNKRFLMGQTEVLVTSAACLDESL